MKPVSVFASCLRGIEAMEIGIHQVASAVDARHGLLSRRSEDASRAVMVAMASVVPSRRATLSRPFCDEMSDIDPWRLRVGSCLFASQLDQPEQQSPVLERWYAASGCRDLCVITLEVNQRQVDRLELHFDQIAGRKIIDLCEDLAEALPMFYQSRTPQVIEDTIQRNRAPGRHAATRKLGPVLSEANPYKLTRTEYRICHVISRGICYKMLPEKLGISPHTVRTHLRNIYAKLDVGDFHELSYRLVSIEERMASTGGLSMVS
ncbi:LuxR C-terminal-related transcriptional regulator [Sulfitobacter sp. LCG007]